MPSLRSVVFLCLPTIIGSALFIAAAVSLQFPDFNPAPPIDDFSKPNVVDDVKMAVGVTVFIACYVGAMLGPLLLPLAVWKAIRLNWISNVQSTTRVWAWIVVLLGLTSAALYWGWAAHLDVFI
jgi:sterol desaturase/sphingolipid hydroxylase (fatty acid hydroxylase superfamily)